MSILEQQRSFEGFFKDMLSSNSESTRQQYRSALKDFEKYCLSEYSKTLEQMLPELAQAKIQDRLLMIQRWVNDSKSIASTKRQRAGFVNRYLYYREIDIDSRDWKQLKFGKKTKSFKKPLSRDILKLIFNRSSQKRKALYLFLISTGCRINEAVKLRKKHFIQTDKNIKVEIYQSKNRATRIGFLTSECASRLRPILEKLDDNQLVFGMSENPDQATNTEQQCFRRVTDLLGLGKERRASNQRHYNSRFT